MTPMTRIRRLKFNSSDLQTIRFISEICVIRAYSEIIGIRQQALA